MPPKLVCELSHEKEKFRGHFDVFATADCKRVTVPSKVGSWLMQAS